MDNLSQLFQLNPYVASAFAGQREAIGQDQEQLRTQELAQLISSRMGQESRAQSMHPFDLRAKELSNRTSEAQLPGFLADSRKKGLEADLKAGTLQSDIATGKAKNSAEVYSKIGGHLGSIAGQLDGVSDIEAPMVLSDAFDALNTPPQIKQAFMQRYAKLPAAEARKRMLADADQILAETPQYRQAFDTTSLTTSADIVNTGQRLESAERIAAADREAGKFNRSGSSKGPFNEAEVWQKRVADARSAKDRYSAALGAAQFFEEAGDPRRAGFYDKVAADARAQAERELAAGSMKPGDVNVGGVTGGAVPTNPELPLPGRGGATPRPQPAASGTTTGGRVKVRGPDGKNYTIPQEQLEQARKQGYTPR